MNIQYYVVILTDDLVQGLLGHIFWILQTVLRGELLSLATGQVCWVALAG